MSLIANLEAVKFQPKVQFFVVSYKTSEMDKAQDSIINDESEAQDAVNHWAAANGIQYVVLKTMWQIDAEGNRLLKEYVASVKNGGLTNGTVANWTHQSSRRLAPKPFVPSGDNGPTNTEVDSPFGSM